METFIAANGEVITEEYFDYMSGQAENGFPDCEITMMKEQANRQVMRNHSLRCSDELWQLIENKAKTLNIPTSQYARKLLVLGLAHSNN